MYLTSKADTVKTTSPTTRDPLQRQTAGQDISSPNFIPLCIISTLVGYWTPVLSLQAGEGPATHQWPWGWLRDISWWPAGCKMGLSSIGFYFLDWNTQQWQHLWLSHRGQRSYSGLGMNELLRIWIGGSFHHSFFLHFCNSSPLLWHHILKMKKANQLCNIMSPHTTRLESVKNNQSTTRYNHAGFWGALTS